MKSILLLHGALGSLSQFNELEMHLSKEYTVYKFNFPGHGGRLIPDVPFGIKLFAQETIDYLDSAGVDKADVFGYSMGGYVGLYLALHSRERIGKLFTLGTKFLWNEHCAEHEVKLLDLEKMKQKVPRFYHDLEVRHSPQSLEILVQKTSDMIMRLGIKNELNEEDYRKIESKVLISVGDRDKMVSIDESLKVSKMLPNAQLLVMPGTSHAFEQAALDRIAFEIKYFFKE